MKVIEVPVYKEDGSIEATMSVSPEEAQSLLQFAVNFMVATGQLAMARAASSEESQLTSFNPEKFDA